MSKLGDWKVAVAATLLAGTLAGVNASSTAATLYRWTDANGTPVISDRPPPKGTDYTTLDSRRYGTSGSIQAPKPAGNAAKPEAASSQSSSQTIPRVGAQSNAATVVEKRPDLCEQARDNIFKLETFPRIRTTDDDGTVRFMSEEEIAGQLATAKVVADANC